MAGPVIVKWIADEADARVQAALGWGCEICEARIKHLCTNTIRPEDALPGRVIHFGRLLDRNGDG